MWNYLKTAALMLAALTFVTGVVYPLAITGIAQIAFPRQANGSLVVRGGRRVGSELIGQPFSDPRYFWSRPSATSPFPYNAGASGGSNLGPANPVLVDAVAARVKALRAADPGNTRPVPVDLVTASASGLDPHISPAAADYQVSRIARLRGLEAQRLRELVGDYTQGRTFGVLGEPRVNVLALNLALQEYDDPERHGSRERDSRDE